MAIKKLLGNTSETFIQSLAAFWIPQNSIVWLILTSLYHDLITVEIETWRIEPWPTPTNDRANDPNSLSNNLQWRVQSKTIDVQNQSSFLISLLRRIRLPDDMNQNVTPIYRLVRSWFVIRIVKFGAVQSVSRHGSI